MQKLKTTQNIILGWTERDSVYIHAQTRACVWASIEQSGRVRERASGYGEITCRLWRPARPQLLENWVCMCAKWNRASLCTCVTEQLCVSGKSCGLAHAASPANSSVLTGHRDREGLSSRRLKSTFSYQACELGGMAWCGGGWKVLPDFKIVKSRAAGCPGK